MAAVFICPSARPRHGGSCRSVRQQFDDPGAFLAISAMAEAIVAARSEAARPSLRVNGRACPGCFASIQRGGVAVGVPSHHLQTGRAQNPDRAVEPAEIQLPRLRLQPRPGKLSDPHPSQADRRHARGIFGPLRLGPVFGVVADAEAHAFTGSPDALAAPGRRHGRQMSSRHPGFAGAGRVGPCPEGRSCRRASSGPGRRRPGRRCAGRRNRRCGAFSPRDRRADTLPAPHSASQRCPRYRRPRRRVQPLLAQVEIHGGNARGPSLGVKRHTLDDAGLRYR